MSDVRLQAGVLPRGEGRSAPRTFSARVPHGVAVVLAFVPLAFGANPPTDAVTQAKRAPLKVRLQISRGPHYVGEAILLEVRTVGESKRPEVIVPTFRDADVWAAGHDMRPISTSGIGPLVTEQNLFITKFRVVPRRAGGLTIIGITAKLDERSGVGPPLKLNVLAVPQSGRTSAYLGGVGVFEVKAETSASRVRLGQAFEYRLSVIGPAALGMTSIPGVESLKPKASGLTVSPLPAQVVGDPPLREFRYRVRPSRAGSLVVPPIAIAAFDPNSKRYMTRMSPSVPVRVVDVDRFEPSTLDYQLPPVEPTWSGTLPVAVGVVACILATTATWVGLRPTLARRRSERALRKLLNRCLQRFDHATWEATELGRTIMADLAEYLHVRIGRPLGALTPSEAEDGITRSEADPGLGASARRLVTRCDQAQFAGEGPSAEEIAEEANAFFQELLRRVGRDPGERSDFEKPREAVKTATP